MEKNKNFIYGIAAVRFGSTVIGYIEKGSWDWGGQKGEQQDIYAEQLPDAPVLTLQSSPSTIKPTFSLVQLDYAGIASVMGGTLVGTAPNYTGWRAPQSAASKSGEWWVDFVSGQSLHIPDGTVTANLAGKLTLTEVSKIECQIGINHTGEGAPYEIVDTPAAS